MTMLKMDKINLNQKKKKNNDQPKKQYDNQNLDGICL